MADVEANNAPEPISLPAKQEAENVIQNSPGSSSEHTSVKSDDPIDESFDELRMSDEDEKEEEADTTLTPKDQNDEEKQNGEETQEEINGETEQKEKDDDDKSETSKEDKTVINGEVNGEEATLTETEENEEDILNKFGSPERSFNEVENDEDMLLNDDIFKEEDASFHAAEDSNSKSTPETDVIVKTEEMLNDGELVDIKTEIKSEPETLQKSDIKTETEPMEVDEQRTDENDKEQNVQNDEVNKQKTNAEILRNQIMDTEDLLQIVEQDTEEKDIKEEIIEEEEEEEESEQDQDEQDMQCDRSPDIEEESTKVDAEENAEVDREYQSIVENAEKEEKEKEMQNKLAEQKSAENVENDVENAGEAIETEVKHDENITDNKEEDKTSLENNEKMVVADVSNDIQNDVPENVTPVKASKRTIDQLEKEEEEASDKTVEESNTTDNTCKKLKLDVAENKPENNETTETSQPIVEREKCPDSPVTPVSVPSPSVPLDSEEPVSKESPEKEKKESVLITLFRKRCSKLSAEDLEDMIIHCICDAICYRSEIGQLRHQLSEQEQMADMWRKEVEQLAKQARDLEIVNKKLLQEVRLKNDDRNKPLMPVKITRSVGLQVRSDGKALGQLLLNSSSTPTPQNKQKQTNNSRPNTTPPTKQTPASHQLRSSNNVTKKSPATNNTTPSPQSHTRSVLRRNSSSAIATNGAASKHYTLTNSNNKSPVNRTSILSQALQPASQTVNTVSKQQTVTTSVNGGQIMALPASILNVTPTLVPISSLTSTPVTSNVISTKTANSVSSTATKNTLLQVKKNLTADTNKTIIDLTDEDVVTPNKTVQQNNVIGNSGTSLKLVPAVASKTAVPTSGSSVLAQQRIMYLYNQATTGNSKIMVKLAPVPHGTNNGVLTVPNGSKVTAVSGATTNTVSTAHLQPRLAPLKPLSPLLPKPKHPAPLPMPPVSQLTIAARKPIPPKPHLSIRRSVSGIVLSWKMPYALDNFETIVSYQLYAYQETTSAPSSDMWRKVGDVKALALPMACTLTQFADGNKYHFAVRAVDVLKRLGPFSDPENILL